MDRFNQNVMIMINRFLVFRNLREYCGQQTPLNTHSTKDSSCLQNNPALCFLIHQPPCGF